MCTKKRRVTYTEDEVEVITLFFEGHIQANRTPELVECEQFLKDHSLASTTPGTDVSSLT